MPNTLTTRPDPLVFYEQTRPVDDDWIPAPHHSGSYDDGGVTFRRNCAGEQGSPQAFAAAFDFLQRNADGRYTDRTLMAISRWGFRCDEALRGGHRIEEAAPWVFSAHREVSYDEDTEVKSGGTMALAVLIPAEWGSRLVMATHPDARRQGYARRLLGQASDYVSGIHAYVGNGNLIGQQFLLAVGMMPMSMTNGRSVLYAFDSLPENDGVAR